jgi:hypothetical protein
VRVGYPGPRVDGCDTPVVADEAHVHVVVEIPVSEEIVTDDNCRV